MLKELIAFVFSKAFIKNLGLYLIIVSLIIIGTFYGLRMYTNYGETIDVPDLVNLHVDDAKAVIVSNNLRIEVQDSVYIRNEMPGRIISQNPSSFAILSNGDTITKSVKENRKIYVTISSLTAPNKKMPDLVDLSERLALIKLETKGLSLGKISYEPNQIGDNLILKQLYKGKEIKAGTPIKMGEKIDLVVSKKSFENTKVPDLFGLTMTDAEKTLSENSLNLGTRIKMRKLRRTNRFHVSQNI